VPPFKKLFDQAKDAAHEATRNAERIKREIFDLDKRKAEKQAELENASAAIERADSFVPDIGGNLQCPNCWVLHGFHSDVQPIPSANHVDWFRCKRCNYEFGFEP
jgi:hypothetical protein